MKVTYHRGLHLGTQDMNFTHAHGIEFIRR